MRSTKILILAGDKQNYFLYKKLKSLKINADVFGFELLGTREKKVLDFTKYKTIITSIPFTIDNLTIHSPFSEKNIYITDLIKRISSDTVVIGGPFNFTDKRFIDITRDQDFIIKSIVPTVEEIIKLIIQNSDITIYDSKTLIIGNGLLPNQLKEKLVLLGAQISNNNPDIIINCESDQSKINSIIKTVKKNTLILDVSNSDKQIDKRVIKARGLAIKSAPRTVAKYLYEILIERKLIQIS